MKILITGGAGFIGQYLVKKFGSCFDITVIDNLSEQIHSNQSNPFSKCENVKFINADIRGELNEIRGAKYDICYHLASETGTAQSMFDARNYYDVNVMGTINLLEKLDEHTPVDRIVLASSRSVYGEGDYLSPSHGVQVNIDRNDDDMSVGNFVPLCRHTRVKLKPIGVSDETSINPKSEYALTKFVQEKLVKNYCEQRGKNFNIFRFQNVYGSGQSLKNPYTGVLANFANLSLSDMVISVYEDGCCARDFVHVRDIVDVIANQSFLSQTDGRIIDLGSGKPIPLIEVAEFISAFFSCKKKPVITGQYRVGDIRTNFTKTPISEYLHRKPTNFFEVGLPEFLNFAQLNFDRSNLKLIEKATNEGVKANVLRKSKND